MGPTTKYNTHKSPPYSSCYHIIIRQASGESRHFTTLMLSAKAIIIPCYIHHKAKKIKQQTKGLSKQNKNLENRQGVNRHQKEYNATKKVLTMKTLIAVHRVRQKSEFRGSISRYRASVNSYSRLKGIFHSTAFASLHLVSNDGVTI